MIIFVLLVCTLLLPSRTGFVDSLSSSTFGAGRTSTTLAKTIQNLNAIVSHIQSPELYSPEWAKQIDFHEDKEEGNSIPIANSDIDIGEIITLYPISSISTERLKLKSAAANSDDRILSKRVDLLQEERYPYPHLRTTTNPQSSLFIHSKENVRYSDGWYGNLIPIAATHEEKEGNCRFVPLPSVAPLCGMVATKFIPKGEDIICVQDFDDEDEDNTQLHKITSEIAEEYAHELGDLMPYLQMAYTHINNNNDTPEKKSGKQQTYHTINEKYPNLQKIQSNPSIYTVTDFLSQDECENLISNAQLNIQPCLVKNEETGAVEVDPSRTSTNANIPRRDVPTVVTKIMDLVGTCVEDQMEILQVLNYKAGQEFKPHTDGFDGATTACGFQDSGRIVTVFCYLNDVKAGGTTLFTKVGDNGLEIEPKRGMAVVHFPMSLDLVEDERTEHQGSVAVDEKWILTTWIWKHWKADYRYSEKNLEAALSSDDGRG